VANNHIINRNVRRYIYSDIRMKKETLEEAYKRAVKSGLFKDETLFIAGGKWQAERMYSEEEVHLILGSYSAHKVAFSHKYTYDMWFEQFKKK
jgi:hypothetical protein